MELCETFRGVQSVHEFCRAPYGYSKNRNTTARSGVQETGRSEPAQARTETEGQAAFRFPRPCRLEDFAWSLRLLANEFGIGEALPCNLRHGHTEPLGISHGFSIGVLAVVVAKRLLIDVPEQMERLYADIGPVQATLQETPEILHRVRMHVAIHVLHGMIDNGVLVVFAQSVVGLQFIAEDCCASFYVFTDKRLKGLPLASIHVAGDHLAATLHHAEYNLLAFGPATLDLFGPLCSVHIPSLATDEGFINLDFPAKLSSGINVLQAKPDPVEHVPRALLADVERPVNFPRRNAVLHAGLHPDRNEPLVKAKRRILHDRPNLDGELGLRVPDLALPHTSRSDVAHVLRSTGGANHPVLPFRPMRHEVANAVIGVRKVEDCVLQGLWFVHHRSLIADYD